MGNNFCELGDIYVESVIDYFQICGWEADYLQLVWQRKNSDGFMIEQAKKRIVKILEAIDSEKNLENF